MICHNYIFFDVKDSVSSVSSSDLEKYKKVFVALIKEDKDVTTFSYSTLGLKAKTRLMLWFQGSEVEHIQNLLNKLMHSDLGKHLVITYTLFGITRPSQYSRKGASAEQTINTKERGKYLIVYPFTKTKEWHLLPFEERKTLMIGHMKIGGGFGMIKQQLLYAFGLDDHEFVVSYETEILADFQSLVMELRGTEARRYTENDLPIFTCIYKPLENVLDVV